MNYSLKILTPIMIGQVAFIVSCFFIFFEESTAWYVWLLMAGTWLSWRGFQYPKKMTKHVKKEVTAKLEPQGIKINHVAFIDNRTYLVAAERQDGEMLNLIVNADGG